jgi:hypothetical protein
MTSPWNPPQDQLFIFKRGIVAEHIKLALHETPTRALPGVIELDREMRLTNGRAAYSSAEQEPPPKSSGIPVDDDRPRIVLFQAEESSSLAN